MKRKTHLSPGYHANTNSQNIFAAEMTLDKYRQPESPAMKK
jgi:hypothetical protein